MGPVNKFFNTGQICTKQVTSLESWILSEGRPAMGISFPLYVFFSLKPVRVVFRGELQFFLSLFNFLVSILCCEGLFLLSCSSVFFFFLVLRGVVSSFLDFVWGVTYCSIEGLVSRVFARSLHEYFVTWWVFFSFFLELLCLDLLSCCLRAWFFR